MALEADGRVVLGDPLSSAGCAGTGRRRGGWRRRRGRWSAPPGCCGRSGRACRRSGSCCACPRCAGCAGRGGAGAGAPGRSRRRRPPRPGRGPRPGPLRAPATASPSPRRRRRRSPTGRPGPAPSRPRPTGWSPPPPSGGAAPRALGDPLAACCSEPEPVVPAAVGEGELGGADDVLGGDLERVGGTGPLGLADLLGDHRHRLPAGADRPRGAAHHDVGAMAMAPASRQMRETKWRIPAERSTSGSSSVARTIDSRSRRSALVVLAPVGPRLGPAVLLEDEDALGPLAQAADVHAEPEAVEQLRPQLPLLGVHRPDEDEPRRVPEGDPLALDVFTPIAAASRRTSTRWSSRRFTSSTYEDVPVRLGEDARLEAALAVLDRRLDVDGPDHPVLGGVDRQLDDAHPPPHQGEHSSPPRAAPGSRRTAPRAGRAGSRSGSRRRRRSPGATWRGPAPRWTSRCPSPRG